MAVPTTNPPHTPLEKIWQFLLEKEKKDSTTMQLNTMMEQIRQMNRRRLDNIKTGDRAQ